MPQILHNRGNRYPIRAEYHPRQRTIHARNNFPTPRNDHTAAREGRTGRPVNRHDGRFNQNRLTHSQDQQPALVRSTDILDGNDNYPADRQVAEELLRLAPDSRTLALLGRDFVTKATEVAAVDGVRQFLDVGAGFPLGTNVHEAAGSAARIVYVDYDPIVCAHLRALMPPTWCGLPVLEADLRRPGELIDRLGVEAGVDFNAPVALILGRVLDHVTDQEGPAEIIERFRETMAPGSYVAFTHGSSRSDPKVITCLRRQTHATPAEYVFRHPDELHTLFAGFDLLDPGITRVQDWLGPDLAQTKLELLGGIGVIPSYR